MRNLVLWVQQAAERWVKAASMDLKVVRGKDPQLDEKADKAFAAVSDLVSYCKGRLESTASA